MLSSMMNFNGGGGGWLAGISVFILTILTLPVAIAKIFFQSISPDREALKVRLGKVVRRKWLPKVYKRTVFMIPFADRLEEKTIVPRNIQLGMQGVQLALGWEVTSSVVVRIVDVARARYGVENDEDYVTDACQRELHALLSQIEQILPERPLPSLEKLSEEEQARIEQALKARVNPRLERAGTVLLELNIKFTTLSASAQLGCLLATSTQGSSIGAALALGNGASQSQE